MLLFPPPAQFRDAEERAGVHLRHGRLAVHQLRAGPQQEDPQPAQGSGSAWDAGRFPCQFPHPTRSLAPSQPRLRPPGEYLGCRRPGLEGRRGSAVPTHRIPRAAAGNACAETDANYFFNRAGISCLLPSPEKKKKKRSHQQAAAPKSLLQGAAGCFGGPLVVPSVGTRRGWGRLVPRHGPDPVPVRFYRPQGAFPARLKKVFIVGAPMWFRVPYSIISLLLKEKLRERVSVSRGLCSPAPRLHGGPVPRLCPFSSRFPPIFLPEAARPARFEAVPKGDGVVWPPAPSCWV